ncbi:DNA-binding protein [Edwardsiella hoshinae]|uniref:DNA-binding protein n=1 Tax=Edwardsiella hoshinae TaxID=93378 RepID=A0A376DIC0_9GAMM|nr:DUF1294 domain-containing protein [Edwardsiella hoshinae]AOV97487.1 DNA-binding protein [Edwardsiella hoshinae]QPR29597.1 DUF1294 domain-containing protein [Edwardsiella hoshinae]STC89975.1 Protein of uncharacterised function (DUF1294) [Edwardsiella hoshinae]
MKPTLLCCGALALLLGICLLTAHPAWYGLALVNLLTFLLYGGDKLAARRQWRRIPERILLGIGVVGGWPGGLLGQWLFRHKTRKEAFRNAFLLSVVANLLLLLALWYGLYGRWLL